MRLSPLFELGVSVLGTKFVSQWHSHDSETSIDCPIVTGSETSIDVFVHCQIFCTRTSGPSDLLEVFF